MRRVAVTGLGVVCAVGKDCDEFFANLMAGRSGIQSMRFDLDGSQMIALAACVRDDELAKAFPCQTVSLDRFTQLALTATSEAVRRSGIQFDQVDLTRAGVSFGTAIGGISTIEAGYIQLLARDAPRVNPLTIPIGMNNAAAARMGLEYGLEGPNLTYSVAC